MRKDERYDVEPNETECEERKQVTRKKEITYKK